LLNVWATWCISCRVEHPFLNKLQQEGVSIVGIDYKDDADKAIKWLEDLHNPYDMVVFDENGKLGLDLGVYGAPETYLIDSKGVVRYRHVGELNERVWRAKLEKLYQELHIVGVQ